MGVEGGIVRQAITTTPTALAGITVGTNYTMQNRSPRPIFVEVAATAPTGSGGAFVMPSAPGEGSAGIAKADAGESIFVWSVTAGGAVVYDEAP